VAAVLISLLIVGWLINDFLRTWTLFVGSYILSRIIIWFVADYLKVRWLQPLNEARAKRSLLTQKLVPKTDNLEDYRKTNYHGLYEISEDSSRINSMSDETFRSFALAYAYKVQKRIIHIHHFILGIPLMPLTWILYFYHVTWGLVFHTAMSGGMVVAGSTFALFMSEFYQLLTQEWGP
jgi:Na+/melibiose symporter-like transporter